MKRSNVYVLLLFLLCVILFLFIIYPREEQMTEPTPPIIIADSLAAAPIEPEPSLPEPEPPTADDYSWCDPPEPHSCSYDVAHQIWDYLVFEIGLSEPVAAGIMGNIMSETGGQTLKIKVVYWSQYVSPGKYYGICQWSYSRGKSVWGKGLEEQLELLHSELRYEMNTYGRLYAKGFNYESFCQLDNEQDAALAFAKCFERCASSSYGKRQRNATTAYNHFMRS